MAVRSPLANISGPMLYYIRCRAGRRNRAELVRFLQAERVRREEMRRSDVPMSVNGTIAMEARMEVPSKVVDYWRTFVGEELFDDYLVEARKLFPFTSSLVPPDMRSDLGFGPPRTSSSQSTEQPPPGTIQEADDECSSDQT